MSVPTEVTRYLERLVGRLRSVLGDDLIGAYALGSVALGGYRPESSDLDVYAVVETPLEAAANTGAAEADHVGLDPALEPTHWFVLDLAIAHERGVALSVRPRAN